MKVTEEAKGLLFEAMKENEASCILVREMRSCCGTQLNFSLAKTKDGDKIEKIDGVPFMMDAGVKNKVGGVTIRAEQGRLYINDENQQEGAC